MSTGEPNEGLAIYSILDEIHDEFDAADYDEELPSVGSLRATLAEYGRLVDTSRQGLVDLAAVLVALIAAGDANDGLE